MRDTRYVYVIVRRDLPGPQLVVQSSHATLAATDAFSGGNPITHPHLVVCSAQDEAELAALFNRLKDEGVKCCAWYEEDLGGSLTAVATAPLAGKERRPLRGLPLLSLAPG